METVNPMAASRTGLEEWVGQKRVHYVDSFGLPHLCRSGLKNLLSQERPAEDTLSLCVTLQQCWGVNMVT